MEIFYILFLILIILGLIYMLIRNEFAYGVRKRILDAIKYEGDIAKNLDDLKKVEVMLDKYPSINTFKMMFSFKTSQRMEKECRKIVGLEDDKK